MPVPLIFFMAHFHGALLHVVALRFLRGFTAGSVTG